jgi:hypothetical protein
MLMPRTDDGPLMPPYPNPGYLPGWRGRLVLALWVAAAVLLCLRVEYAWLLFLPGLAGVARTTYRAPRLRERALDGLEEISSEMTAEQRDQHLSTLLRLYGGGRLPRIKRRVETIRRLPTRDKPGWPWAD